ncbi:shikimate dehydrogenase [Fodinicola acaciae]|uniref:shikimate dehydrogenase n=1 Tax=Fodinicola acaciae TaxID=2681555 RepID=UPI0013D44F0B|nr:shikimate dehydrogenase [Fodinicola acaciae]
MTGRRCAVLGSPVRHSLSPVLHTAAYAALGLDGWTYDRIECDEPGLAPLLAGCGPEWAGFSVTMPLKREALRLSSSRSERAAAVGAANTLVPREAGWHADNTDVLGIVDAVREAAAERTFESASLLGAGGTAQAALAALRELGCDEVRTYVRDPSRAADLLHTAERVGIGVELSSWSSLASGLDADLVISTVPKAAADSLADVAVRADVVLDALYDPWPTPFALAARKSGGAVLSGLDLLLHQAVHQVTLMTGEPGPLEPMRSALRK